MKIRLFCDGTILSDGGGAFGLVPRPKWSKLLAPDENNCVPQVLWTPLVEVDDKLILIDAGMGDKFPASYAARMPHRTLLAQLAAHGVSPADIDMVILTHMHGDHVGWATGYADADRNVLRATFPNALYVAQRTEFEDASNPNERTRNTYFGENFQLLHRERRMVLLDGDAQLSRSVTCVCTPGHTAGHQSVILDDGSGAPPVFLLGEMATYMVQFVRLPWVTAYDVLPMHTIDSKRRWQAWAHEKNAVCVCAHEPGTPVATLTRDSAGFYNYRAVHDPRISIPT
jgi:glyoxylase-like metal-dependent hydrolase (beta-lactamase superfamily II)